VRWYKSDCLAIDDEPEDGIQRVYRQQIQNLIKEMTGLLARLRIKGVQKFVTRVVHPFQSILDFFYSM
jgi:hypothetical protein